MVYAVIREGIDKTAVRVFKDLDAAEKFKDDMNDKHNELYARKDKNSGKFYFPGNIYKILQFKVY